MKRTRFSSAAIFLGLILSFPVVMPASGVPVPTSVPAASGPRSADDNRPPVRVYMPDGQLKSHTVRVYLSQNIHAGQNPRLRLLRSHAVTRKAIDEANLLEPGLVAPGQEWVESVDGARVRRTGTLLLFDLSDMSFRFKAMQRVLPVVSWMEGGSERVAVGASEVNVADIVATLCYTLATLGLSLLLVIWMARKVGNHPLHFLAGADGHLSLARTQVACWTVAVGGVVLGYGFIRLHIPDIPDSLLVLMGASLTTGGVGSFKDVQKQRAAVVACPPPIPVDLQLADLVRVFTQGQPPELSLAKAQMLFWTLLLLVLFIAKSILDGAIWEVPWPLVALLGFSQAGYLASKLNPQNQ